jgi:hypothetical protein
MIRPTCPRAFFCASPCPLALKSKSPEGAGILALPAEADARIRTADPFITSALPAELRRRAQEDSAPTKLCACRRDRHGGRGSPNAVPRLLLLRTAESRHASQREADFWRKRSDRHGGRGSLTLSPGCLLLPTAGSRHAFRWEADFWRKRSDRHGGRGSQTPSPAPPNPDPDHGQHAPLLGASEPKPLVRLRLLSADESRQASAGGGLSSVTCPLRESPIRTGGLLPGGPSVRRRTR